MASLPKLLPSWHDLSLQDFVRQKAFSMYLPLNTPDFGGIGVDVNIGAKRPCKIPKFYNSQLKFASDKCALPLFSLESNDNLTEPCLESLEKEKIEFDQFSLKLTHMRNNATKKTLREKLTSFQAKVNSLKSENYNEDINIAVPKSIVQLADSLPKRAFVPVFNVAYVGGNLAVCRYSGKQALVHPNGINFNNLCITPLLAGNDQHCVPSISEQVTISLKNEPILQIDEAINGFCVRQNNSFHLINANNLNICSKTVHKAALYHIAANPYNPEEILSVYEKGVMKLKNMTTKKTIWSMLDNVYDNLCPLYPTWRCSFGSNPFSTMCLNESKLYHFDIREQKNAARVLFDADNSSFFVGEELVGLKMWNRNPFQHFLTSSHHLTLCDERYPKTPVMHWNHCLKNLPVYLECADIDSDVSIIVIATQKNPQVASFLCSNQADIQPVSLGPPLLLSSPSDCIKSLKFHSYYIDDKLSKRFSSPLTGVCIVPHNSDIGFTVVQSTSLGDIFYQDFKQSPEVSERTYHVSTGCILTPPEKILPHLKELISTCNSDEMVSKRNEACTDIVVNIDKILSSPKEISSNCMLCRLGSSAEDKELALSEICLTCNLSRDESQHFTKAMSNESVIIGPVSEEAGHLDCDTDYLLKFDDKYSKRILSVWIETNEIGENPDEEAEFLNVP